MHLQQGAWPQRPLGELAQDPQHPHFSRKALDGLGCLQAPGQPPWPLRRVVRKQAVNTGLFPGLGSVDVPLPESNIVRTIMEFLSFLHLKGMGMISI